MVTTQEKEEGQQYGTIRGAVRLGDRAAIGNGFHTSAHGGCIETVLDEATAELVKCELVMFMATSEITIKIKKPVPLHTSLIVEATVSDACVIGVGECDWFLWATGE